MNKPMFTLAVRRLQRIHTGYYVSCPMEWCKHHNLERRDEIKMFVDDQGRLVLEPIKQVVANESA